MNKIFLLLPVIIFIVLSGCDLDDYPFLEVTGDSLEIEWSIDTEGSVDLLMLNCYMSTVRTFEPTEGNPCPAGDYSTFWDMTDSTGNRVIDGLYYFRVMLDGTIVDTQLFEVYQ